VPLAALTSSATHNTLFTSGTLGRYSKGLKALQDHQSHAAEKSAAV
jgi:hypothetical protein